MPNQNGAITLSEILSQPEAWRDALEVLAASRGEITHLIHTAQPDEVIFTGCGSTYYLSLAAASILTEMSGMPARGIPASELWLYPHSAYPVGKRVLLVAVSRSGETTETIRACESFLSKGRGQLATISCYAGKPLASLGGLNLILPSGMEESVAQTRAFSTLYLACVALTIEWSNHSEQFDRLSGLSQAGRHVLGTSAPIVKALATAPGIDRFYFLGSGPRFGLASELSLKMKEMSLSHSEPFHFMEFRHGPKSMISPEALVVGLLSSSNREAEQAVLNEMEAMGGQILSIAEEKARVDFGSGLEENLRNILYLPAGQLLAFERSISKGLNPDRPANLNAVVHLP